MQRGRGAVLLLETVELDATERGFGGRLGDGGDVGDAHRRFESLRARDGSLKSGEYVGRDPVHEDALGETRGERNHGHG